MNHQNKRKAKNEMALNYYEVLADILDMNMVNDQFNSSGVPEDIVRIPTEQTLEMLERWQAISESEINFLKETGTTNDKE